MSRHGPLRFVQGDMSAVVQRDQQAGNPDEGGDPEPNIQRSSSARTRSSAVLPWWTSARTSCNSVRSAARNPAISARRSARKSAISARRPARKSPTSWRSSARSSARRCSRLRVEAGVIELVELAEIRSVSQVHGVEPVHQFVGYILAQGVIEALGQPGGHRHAMLQGIDWGDSHKDTLAPRSINLRRLFSADAIMPDDPSGACGPPAG